MQLLGKGQDDVLLKHARGGDGAGIDTTVARVDDDQRLLPLAAIGRRQLIGLLHRLVGLVACKLVLPLLLLEGGGGRLEKVENHASRLVLHGRQHKRLVDLHGAGDVQHDARPTGRELPVAPVADETAPGTAGAGRQTEVDLGQVDDHAIGFVEGEGAEIDLPRKVEHETGAALVADDATVRRHRRIGGKRTRRQAGKRHCRQHDGTQKDSEAVCNGRQMIAPTIPWAAQTATDGRDGNSPLRTDASSVDRRQ